MCQERNLALYDLEDETLDEERYYYTGNIHDAYDPVYSLNRISEETDFTCEDTWYYLDKEVVTNNPRRGF